MLLRSGKKLDGEEEKMWVYYGHDLGQDQLDGWYIGPDIGSEDFVASHPNSRHAIYPPLTGWYREKQPDPLLQVTKPDLQNRTK